MLAWSEEAVAQYFESGGEAIPASPASEHASTWPNATAMDLDERRRQALARMAGVSIDSVTETDFELESARSSIDACVENGRLNDVDMSTGMEPTTNEPIGVEMIDDDLEPGGEEERTEDAMLDVPMASVPVTGGVGLASKASAASTAASERDIAAAAAVAAPDISDAPRRPPQPPPPLPPHEMADADDDVAGWSIKELKAFLRARGADTRGLAEKRDFVEEVRRLRAVAGTNAAPAAARAMAAAAAAAAATRRAACASAATRRRRGSRG